MLTRSVASSQLRAKLEKFNSLPMGTLYNVGPSLDALTVHDELAGEIWMEMRSRMNILSKINLETIGLVEIDELNSAAEVLTVWSRFLGSLPPDRTLGKGQDDEFKKMTATLKVDFRRLSNAINLALASSAASQGVVSGYHQGLAQTTEAVQSAEKAVVTLQNRFDQLQSEFNNRFAEMENHSKSSNDEAIRAIDRDLRSAYLKLYDDLKEAINQAKEFRDDFNRLRAEAGVGQFSKNFRLRANRLAAFGIVWLSAGVLCNVAAVAFAWYVLKTSTPLRLELNTAVIEHFAARILALVVLFGLGVFCLRMYRSKRHMAEDYQHRALALETFAVFTNSTLDRATQDRVLLAACDTIFGHPTTGLVGNGELDDAPAPLKQAAEIAAAARGSK